MISRTIAQTLAALRDDQKRDRFLARARKRALHLIRKPRSCRAIFVFGSQRSGTTMLMHAFHRHPEAMVWDENRDNRVFLDHRVRDFGVIRDVIAQSRFPIICFKPICDSHLIARFATAFPDGHFVWIYRHYVDVAISAQQKFQNVNRAIRLVCAGEPGGGWFAEGVSESIREVLIGVCNEKLSQLDFSCLTWWARNQLLVESGLLTSRQVTLLRYETLVSRPDDVFQWLFRRIGVPFHERVARRINERSVGRHGHVVPATAVRNLCDRLLGELDAAFRALKPPA